MLGPQDQLHSEMIPVLYPEEKECCASSEIFEILLVDFIFIKFPVTPLQNHGHMLLTTKMIWFGR